MKSVAQCNGAIAAGKKIIGDAWSVVGWPSPLSVTFQMLWEAAGLIARGMPLTTTLVICPTILAVLTLTFMQITAPWISCTTPVAVIIVKSYCPFAARGVGELLVLSATNEYCSLAMVVKNPVPSVSPT